MKRNQVLYTLLALFLLGFAGYLTSRHDEKKGGNEKDAFQNAPIKFPRQQGHQPRQLQYQIKVPKETPGKKGPTQRKPETDMRAPLEKAVNAADGNPFLFVEFNGLQHNPLAEALLDCHKDQIDQTIKGVLDGFGIDLRKDVDRIAIAPDLFAISGFFEHFKLPTPPPGSASLQAENYGAGGQIFDLSQYADQNSNKNHHFAQVGENLLLISRERASLEQAIDRIEGREAIGVRPAFYGAAGDLYGQIAGAWLAPLQTLLAHNVDRESMDPQTIDKLLVRSFVDDHLAISADIQLKDPQKTPELINMGRGLLAAARFDAMNKGDKKLASILDQVKLFQTPKGGIASDLALPKDLVLEMLGCPNSMEGSPSPLPNGDNAGF